MRPIPGDPQALRDAASALSTRAGDLSTHRGSARGARHAALAQWDGSASMSFGGTMATYAKDIDRQAAALLRLSTAVRTFAGALERHQIEDRALRRTLAAAEYDVRVLRSEARLAADPVSAARADRDLAAALRRVRTTRGSHDALWVRHRRSVAALNTALGQANPPEKLWHEGARRVGLGMTTVTALTKGRATVTVLRLGAKSNLTEKQAAKYAASSHKLQRGPLGTVIEKGINRAPNSGLAKTFAALGPVAELFFLYDAVKPGLKDVRTGGGYTGWRDVGTRIAGIAQIGGVIMVRFPHTRPAGAASIAGWVVWKSANSIHDNDDWVNKELPKVIVDQIEQNVPMAPLVYAAVRNMDEPYTGRARLDPAVQRRISAMRPKTRPATHNPVFDKPDWEAFRREGTYGPPAPPSWQQRLALAPRREVVAP